MSPCFHGRHFAHRTVCPAPSLKHKLLLTFVPSVSDDYTCANRKQWRIPNGSNLGSGKETILGEWQKERKPEDTETVISPNYILLEGCIYCIFSCVYMCACSRVCRCTCVCRYTFTCVCTCMWMPEVGVRYLSQWLFPLHLTYWSRVSLWNQRLPIPLV